MSRTSELQIGGVLTHRPQERLGELLDAGATGCLAGGADEMLPIAIAEKILSLPQDHRPDKGVPFNQIPT